MDLLTLIATCVPMVAPTTMKAIVLEESRGHPYAIHDGETHRALFPRSRDEAVATARDLIDAGTRIDAGLAQINSENWAWLGLDPVSVFDPCTNLAAAETVLIGTYTTAPFTLDAALSRYNSGDAELGVRNGYVDRVKHWMAKPPPDRDYSAPGQRVSDQATIPVTARIQLDPDTGSPTTQPEGQPKTPPWRFTPVLDGFGNG